MYSKKTGHHKKSGRSTGILLPFILLLALSSCFPSTVRGFEGTVDAAIGYDDNPAVTNQIFMGRRPVETGKPQAGSGFVSMSADIYHNLEMAGGMNMELSAGGFNTSYFDSGSKNQGIASLNLSYPLSQNSFIPSVYAGGSIYRDYLVPLNNINNFFTGLLLRIIPSAKLDISVEGACHWNDYQEDIVITQGPGHPKGTYLSNRTAHGPGRRKERKLSRDDTMLEGGISATFYLSPEFTAVLGAGYARQDSSIRQFSYNQMSISAGLMVDMPASINLDINGSYFHTWHDHTAPAQDKSQGSWRFDTRLIRPWKVVEFYASFSHEQNITLSDGTGDFRNVTQAGITWSF